MANDTTTLQEIRSDVKEIKDDFTSLQLDLMEIKSKMPSMDKVQELEVKLTTLQTQFKVVWAAIGAVGIVALSSVVASLFRLIGV